MLINNLELSHFRNYDHFFIEFDKGINILIGGNAQGKTNIIEAIYLLSVCRSFRTHINDQMIQFDYNFAKVKGNIYSNQRNHQAELVLSKENKKRLSKLFIGNRLRRYRSKNDRRRTHSYLRNLFKYNT